MVAKFVIGLTDVIETESFFHTPHLEEAYGMTPEMTQKYVYILQNNDTSIEKASLEWELDTTLPAVSNLMNVIDIVKSNLNVTQIHHHTYGEVLPGVFDTDYVVEFKNLLPNTDLVLPEYTDVDYDNISATIRPIFCSLELDATASTVATGVDEIETLFYAIFTDDRSFLKDGPMPRAIYPSLRINFILNNEEVPSKTMSANQQQWMDDNKEFLESKNYYVSDKRNRLGALIIGELIGSPDDAFSKIQQYNKICRVEIIRD